MSSAEHVDQPLARAESGVSMTVNHDRSEASATPTQRDPADHGHRHLGLALVVIATAQLMVILDASIVNIALPSIQTALDFTPTNLTWVINGYTLAFGGLLLLGGRAGDLFGRRRVSFSASCCSRWHPCCVVWRLPRGS